MAVHGTASVCWLRRTGRREMRVKRSRDDIVMGLLLLAVAMMLIVGAKLLLW
jgi:hypothetical protein